jgi:hypothetical protein
VGQGGIVDGYEERMTENFESKEYEDLHLTFTLAGDVIGGSREFRVAPGEYRGWLRTAALIETNTSVYWWI